MSHSHVSALSWAQVLHSQARTTLWQFHLVAVSQTLPKKYWMHSDHGVRLGDVRVSFKFCFVRDIGAAMPQYTYESVDLPARHGPPDRLPYSVRPTYQECGIEEILDDQVDYYDELTKCQMLKLALVFQQRGDWVHKDAKVILGKMQVGLGTFKCLKRIPDMGDMGAAIFQGPMTNPKATWYQKQVVIRAFIVEVIPAFVVNIGVERTMVQNEGRVKPGPWLRPSQARPSEALMASPVDANPGVEVTIEGAIGGTMWWSEKYIDAYGVEMKAAIKEYKTFFTRSRKAKGEAPIALKFIMDEKEIDHTDRRLLRDLCAPSSPLLPLTLEPAAKKHRGDFNGP